MTIIKRLRCLAIFILITTLFSINAYADGDNMQNDDTHDVLVPFNYVNLYDSDNYSPPHVFGEGTYKLSGDTNVSEVDSDNSISIYKEPYFDSSIAFKVPRGTYHNIQNIRNNFGFIRYKDVEGWVKMENVVKIKAVLSEDLVQNLNETAETIRANINSSIDFEISEFEKLKQDFASLEESLMQQNTAEEYESRILDVHKQTQEVNAINEFINDPNGKYKDRYRFYGDVNNDKLINMHDIVLMQKCIAQLIEFDSASNIASDTDGDGNLTMTDVVTMQKYVAELIHIPMGLLFHA